MALKINSVFRVHRILEGVNKANLNEPAIDVWASVFGIKRIARYQFNVIQKLDLFSQELERACESVKGNVEITPDLFETAFSSARQVIDINNLGHNLTRFQNLVNQEKLNLLRICSELLNDEEELIPDEELEKIAAEIQGLHASINQEYESDKLKQFVLQHLELIQNALQDYFIIGLRAFKSAYYEAHTVIFKDQNLLLKEKDGKQALNKVGKLWKQVCHFVDKADKAASKMTRLLTAGEKIIEHGSGLFDKIGDLLQ